MINQLVRYLPIIDYINENRSVDICEIGSGSYGIGKFLKIPFVGCDNTFTDYSDQEKKTEKDNLMKPIKCQASDLPFKDSIFDLVFSLDTFEHLSPEDRIKCFLEMHRVSKKKIIIAFPQGDISKKIDKKLDNFYRLSGRKSPIWLKEHLEGVYPQNEFFEYLKEQNYKFIQLKNENIFFHLILALIESIPILNRLLILLSQSKLPIIKKILTLLNFGTCYRKIYFIEKL